MPLSSGARLGPYEGIGPLGAGGMGEVHQATDTKLGRQVAIKALRRDHRDHDWSVLNWFEELTPRP